MKFSRRASRLEKLSKKDVIKLYDRNAAKYEAFYAAEQGPKHEASLTLVEPEPPVLDAGCGTGLLLRRLGVRAVGLDISIGMLREAKRSVKAPLVLGDVESLPFRDSAFRTVYSITVVQLSENPVKALRELARVTSRGGRLVVSAHRSTRTAKVLDKLVKQAGLSVERRAEPDEQSVDLILACTKP